MQDYHASAIPISAVGNNKGVRWSKGEREKEREGQTKRVLVHMCEKRGEKKTI